jgi:hypothetical protein
MSGTYSVPLAAKGSQRWLQIAVNRAPELLNAPLLASMGMPGSTAVEWLSPLEVHGYLEYQDQPFLDRLGVVPPNRTLADFWPASGARWDGLARTSAGDLLLVEAKANVKELVTSATGATGASLARIKTSLEQVRQNLAPKATAVEWSGTFYQQANRLAHLHFLRVQNELPAHLVYIYFLNAPDVATVRLREEYEAANFVIECYLGMGRHKLSRYIHKLYIDVNELLHHAPTAAEASPVWS